jgi:2-polyprenyl-3-methyl-5-hydroxy-6-metoxy-1,4-benzoquinol methylase
MSAFAPFLPAERDEILAYLKSVYGNVFTDAAIKAHVENHVGFAASDYAIAVMTPHARPGARLLDVGSGFGSCVLAARQKGFDAVGIEVASFEVKFARERLARVRPQDEPGAVYRLGSFLDFDAPDGSFDIVTFWNVLEHIEDLQTTLSTAKRLLRKGGILYVVCPN